MGMTRGSIGIEDEEARIISPELARALSNPLRARILIELNLRDLSPSRFVEEVGGEITAVSREFRKLRDWGFAEVVGLRREKKGRRAPERVYRALVRTFFDAPGWEALPQFVREDLTANSTVFYYTRIRESIGTGNFDGEEDRHFSWTAPSVDREGWREIQERLDEVLDFVGEVEERSAERMKESAEAPIPMTVGLAGFRSPTPAELRDYRRRRREEDQSAD
jgi:DNA-binding transcriptional ArsR family regulator